MITCMKIKSFILKYASKIMFYAVNIAPQIGGYLVLRIPSTRFPLKRVQFKWIPIFGCIV